MPIKTPYFNWLAEPPLSDVLPLLRETVGGRGDDGSVDPKLIAHAASLFNVVAPIYHVARSSTQERDRILTDALHGELQDITHDNLVLAMALVKLSARLEKAGISYLSFKGVVNAVVLYGDLSRRRCGDIDLIVPVSQFEKAEALLKAEGYQFVRRYERSLQATYQHETNLASIDLHWGIPPFSLELNPAPLWAGKRPVPVLNGSVNSLDLEGILIMLAINCTKEPWQVSLHQAYDLAHLLAFPTKRIDWHRVMVGAHRVRATRMVNSALTLVQTLFDLPAGIYPLYLARHFRGKRGVLAELLYSVQRYDIDTDLGLPAPVSFKRWTQYFETLHGTPWYRRSRVLRRLFVASDADRQWLPLPRGLVWLYCVLRPSRMLWQSVKRLMSRL